MSRHLSLIFTFLLVEGLTNFLSLHACAQSLSPYVLSVIDDALTQRGLERDPEAEGKAIERIEIAAYDVIEDQDPYPRFAAAIHSKTRDEVIERELLLHVGDSWAPLLAQESERNLRSNLFLSLSHLVACKSSDPNQVVLLVVTKDLWSLRPGFDILWVGTQLQHLGMYMTEQNFLGRRKIPGLDFSIDVATFLAGQRYRDPRVWGSRFYLSERGDLIWNKTTGVLEGGIAEAEFGLPLFSLASAWGFHLGIQYQKNIYREYQSGSILRIQSPENENALLQYRQERAFLRAELQYSMGRRYKWDLSGGWKGWTQRFEYYPTEGTPSVTILNYLNQYYIPRTEAAGTLFVQARFYMADFLQLYDMERFEVPEDFRLGPDIRLETRFASPAFGLSQAFIEPEFQLDWLVQWAQHYLSFEAHGRARYQPGLTASDWVNQVYLLRGKFISAPFWKLRLVTAIAGTRRFFDLNRELSTLGSSTSLRGFAAGYLYGQQSWNANIEIRTLPFRVRAFSLGGAAFFDLGNAFGTTYWGDVFGSIGIGFRMGMPQFNRSLLRVDFGFPVIHPPAAASYFVLSFGQAF